MASLPAQRSKHLFVQLAFQYHVAGRSAVIDGLSPVCGNLLHHAVEMALKAALTDVLTLPDLKKLNHSLPKIWGAFTSSFPDADISVFNQAIAQLDRFEDLRYPDYVLATERRSELLFFESTSFLINLGSLVWGLRLQSFCSCWRTLMVCWSLS